MPLTDVNPIRPPVFVPRPEPSRGSRVHVARRCAYRRWLPEEARACQCWKCQLERESGLCRGCKRNEAGARGGLCDTCSADRNRELTRARYLARARVRKTEMQRERRQADRDQAA